MKIPIGFKEDLIDVYDGIIEVDELINKNKNFILKLVRNVMNFISTNSYHIDSDDIYQEACIWLVTSIWDWDSSRGIYIWDYVVYQIGVRLRNVIDKEKQLKRGGKKCRRNSIDIYEYKNFNINTIDTNNPEKIAAIRETLRRNEQMLTDSAKKLTKILIEEGGNYHQSIVRLMKEDPIIVKRFGPNIAIVKHAVKKYIYGEISYNYNLSNIITDEG